MDNRKYAIIAKNVSKRYKMYKNSKEKLIDLLHPKGCGADFYALKDISFKVEKGKSVGLIGVNGAGKSTLSNILAGVSIPTNGEIEINGEPAIIAIGSGLNNFLTGIENIEIKALMMGFDKERIEEIKHNVIEFAEIGEFINQPIRTYSSGMRSRLGFAISIHIDPDIIIIDEALSVGDPTFTKKCLDKMNEFKERGKTIFFVSHSIGQVREFCDEAIWLEYGMIKEYGSTEEILPKYQEYLNMINKMSNEEKKAFKLKVLKEQNHHLLKEFKVIDTKYKKLTLTGNMIKYAKLINKSGDYKVIPYNFDHRTFVLGFIEGFRRKQYGYGALMLMLEAIAIFISPGIWGILSRFLLTFVIALFSGKKYVNDLIENQEYMPYEVYKDEMDKFDNNSIRMPKMKDIKRFIKKENISFAIFLAIIISGISLSAIYTNFIGVKETEQSNESEVEVIKPQHIDEKILMVIESDGVAKEFGFIDMTNESIVCESYPAELLVSYNGKVTPLYEVYIQEGYIPTEVLETVLKKEGYTQISIDEKNLVENNINLDKDVYKNILSEIFKSENYKVILDLFKSKDENSLNIFKENAEYIRIELEDKIEEKYRLQNGSYKYKSIEEITTDFIIRYYALDKNIKYYYINDKDLESYDEVAKIRELERRHLELEEENDNIDVYNPEGGTNSGGGSSSGGSTNSGGGSSSGGSTNSGGGSSSGGSTNSGGGSSSGGSTNSGGGSSSGGSTNPDGGSGSGGSTNPDGGSGSGGSTNPDGGSGSGGSTSPDGGSGSGGSNLGGSTNPEEG